MGENFGEIVHPMSRAFWSEDDDDNDDEDAGTFTVDWTEPCPEIIQTFIIAETPLIKDFVEKCVIQGRESICTIKYSTLKNSSKIFHLGNNSFICVVDPQVTLPLAADFVESIAPILSKSESTIAVACNHISQLKTGEKNSELSFMRSLSTKNAPEKQRTLFPTLSQPNIVAGVAAGVIAYAEVMELPATLTILYVDGFELDSTSATPLVKLFKNFLGYKIQDFRASSNICLDKGNLYM